MQSDHKQVYKFTAQRTGRNEQMYKDLGNFVFTEVLSHMKKPTCLIIKLKGIGTWWLRKKRMEIILGEWDERAKVKTRDQFESDNAFNTYLEEHEMVKIFEDRLKEYEEYIEIRNRLRKERYENTVLLEPDQGED